MRIWFGLKKIIAVLAILLVMYLLTGFFYWHYVVNPTIVTENSQQIIDAMKPVTAFFQPASDFFAMVYDMFLNITNSK